MVNCACHPSGAAGGRRPYVVAATAAIRWLSAPERARVRRETGRLYSVPGSLSSKNPLIAQEYTPVGRPKAVFA
jgi:hypothetical protein